MKETSSIAVLVPNRERERGESERKRGFALKCEEASWQVRLVIAMMHAGLMSKVDEK